MNHSIENRRLRRQAQARKQQAEHAVLILDVLRDIEETPLELVARLTGISVSALRTVCPWMRDAGLITYTRVTSAGVPFMEMKITDQGRLTLRAAKALYRQRSSTGASAVA